MSKNFYEFQVSHSRTLNQARALLSIAHPSGWPWMESLAFINVWGCLRFKANDRKYAPAQSKWEASQDVTVDKGTDFPVVLTPALSILKEAMNGLTITPLLA